jgi:hypothetical protein
MQFVCPGWLPTFVANVPNVSTIYVILEEEGSKVPPPKKPKRIMMSHKCQYVWVIHFLWEERLKSKIGEIHCVKCMVYSFVKSKDVILGPKANTLELL